jgi:hypothetical protein
MKLTELFTATGEPFSYYPGLVHQFDISVNATVFLCFIAWRTFPDELGGWKLLSIDIVKEATGLSVKEQSTARKQLVKAGLILERYARLEHKLKFKLLPAEIAVSPNAESAHAQTPKGNIGTPLNGVSTKELKGDKKGTNKEGGKPPKFDPASISLPQSLRTPEFAQAWCAWCDERVAKKKPISERAAALQLKNLASWGVKGAVDSIESSISNGYQGLFAPREVKARQPYVKSAQPFRNEYGTQP